MCVWLSAFSSCWPLCTIAPLDFSCKNMTFLIMFFCVPMAYLHFYSSITCYVISPLLFVMLSTCTSGVCCLSLHCLGLVRGSDLSHLSLTWTLVTHSPGRPEQPRALLLHSQLLAGLHVHAGHACHQWQIFLLPLQNEASVQGIGHQPEFIALWVWGQQPRYYLLLSPALA